MRLRLTVRRHNLPDCPIIWDVNTSTSTPTVSELLDQINDVVPIESTEWGMDDYAVEVKGKEGINYECLHFQPVGKVMKEEDEVIIRPLLTHDLRVRRISGRHQISSDGRHLVDGVAFGRPMLKRPVNRPAINIPPRKRPRITIDENDEDDDEDDEEDEEDEDSSTEDLGNSEPVKRVSFLSNLDEDEDEDEDDEDDDDFEPGGDDNEDEEQSDEEFEEHSDEKIEDAGNRQLVLHADFEDDDEESEEEVENTSSRQLVIHADFEDDDEEDDEDFEPGIEEEEELREPEEAFEGFQDDQPTSSTPGDDAESTGKTDELSVADQAVLLDVEDTSTKAKICQLHTAFPKASIAVVKFVLEGSEGDISQAYEALTRGFVPAKSKSSILQLSSSHFIISQPTSQIQNTKSSEAETESKHNGPASANKMDIDDEESGSEEEEEDPLLQHYDQHGLPPGSIKSGKALSFMAEAMEGSPNPKSKLTKFETVLTRNNVASVTGGDLSNGLTSTPAIDLKSNEDEITIDSEGSSDSSSEAESSDSSEESSSEDDSSENDSSKAVETSSSSDSDSDSSSDSSSDDDEAPEVMSSKLAAPVNEAATSKPTPSTGIVAPKSRTPVPPRQGKKATQSRNQRRKQGVALAKFKEQGILPEDTTAFEFNRLEVSDCTSPEDAFAALAVLRANANSAKIQNGTDKALVEANDFEARRRELLASLASGGIEVSPRSGKAVVDTLDVNVSEMVSGAPKTVKDTHKEPPVDSEMAEVPLQGDSNLTPTISDKPITASRRAKLDVGAGRRLLFGALGVKTPKTKKDEDKLRSDLMKDIRVPKIVNPPEEPSLQVTDLPAIDDDSWRDKIVYRAVECCQEGIVLSEPPFPFVQRWDPQQQTRKGGKRKNQAEAYNEESQDSKQRKRRKGKQNYSEDQDEHFDESYQQSYEDDAMETQSTEPPERQVESVEHRADIEDPIQGTPDLVELPEDPATLPNLDADAVQCGMIIAFKQMLMDESTKWQPQISAYRTASILSVDDSGNISVALAKRDRDRPVKHYDENGQRIWGKFEMPDDDEDEEEEDNGEMVVTFNELVEPKIVAPAPVSLSTDISKSGMTTDESVTLNNENEEETQCSHVTETQYFNTDPPASAEIVDVVSTPRNSRLEYLQAEALPESITDSAREDISHLIKEAGFRSNVPSSIVRNFAPNGLEKRDEAPSLDKMRTEIMAEIDATSFSPKFNGFGSSSPVHQRQPTTSPDRQQSSWHTVGSQEPASAPTHDKSGMMENQASETTAQREVSTNMPKMTSDVPGIHTKPPPKEINVDKAQAKLEAVQPRRKVAGPVDADPTLDTIEVDCRAEYPKLSEQSSYTSLVADHGRQPDLSYENMRQQELDTSKTDDVALDKAIHDGDTYEGEPELPPRRPGSSSRPVDNNNIVEPSSEDFPTIEEILSSPSQPSMKYEKNASQPPSKPQADANKSRKVLAAFDDTQSSTTKVNEKSKKVLAAFDDSNSDSDTSQMNTELKLKKEAEIKSKKVMAAFDLSSDEEEQITLKASNSSNPRPAQTRTSKMPKGSQVVMDLTLSSDVEPEPEKDKSKSNDSEGDEGFEVGWGVKAKSNLRGLKRQGSNSLRGTTNTALNAKTSRK
ncbi:hypothetical protein SBOR_5165 [Sclerotinia borealis F-4128]|uniref:CUE domain-containing protein n=1 Tax=Sclerotinia borealis (strain F-4128) TaxID=1432307 RepID=W9CCH2_SCLBF|nr:hypothetical protein SBOR_5165 [Sclerotinia borealis F-4128]